MNDLRINAIAFSTEGFNERLSAGKDGKQYVFDLNYKIDGSDYIIRDNLNRLLNLLRGGQDDPGEEYHFSYTNSKDGQLISGYVDTYPSTEVQNNLQEFKDWFQAVVELWITENGLTLIKEKEELQPIYILKINCSL